MITLPTGGRLGDESLIWSSWHGQGSNLCLWFQVEVDYRQLFSPLSWQLYLDDVAGELTSRRTRHKWKRDDTLSIVHRQKPVSSFFFSSNLLSCLKKYSLWWALLTIALALAFQLRSLEIVLPRNLKLSTVSIRWPSMHKRSMGDLLLRKSMIISLVLVGLRLSLLSSHHNAKLLVSSRYADLSPSLTKPIYDGCVSSNLFILGGIVMWDAIVYIERVK